MSSLSKKDLETLKAKLLAEKAKIERELSTFAVKDDEVEDNYKAQYEDLGSSEEDNALEFVEQERKVSLEHTLEVALKDVNNALKRVDEENYGICKYCKEPIRFERLMIRPESSSCIKCKSILQGNK